MRLVIHAGAEYADRGAVGRDLLRHRAPLAAAGLALPPSDDLLRWRRLLEGWLHRDEAAMAVLTNARGSGADAFLLSSDVAADLLASPDEAARLAEFGAAEGLELRVVVVVREQIGYINSLYCHRVLNLDTARSFGEFTEAATPAHRFDYVASFGAIADTPGIELVAIPYPVVVELGAGPAVVDACGLPGGVPGPLAAEADPGDPAAGPVALGAMRLLHKRLRRLNSFHEQGRAVLRVLAEQLAARAAETGWDDGEYWGWDVPLRRKAQEEYAASNAVFAEFVWGGSWPEPFSTGPPVRADLADLEPAMLQEVLTTVESLVASASKFDASESD